MSEDDRSRCSCDDGWEKYGGPHFEADHEDFPDGYPIEEEPMSASIEPALTAEEWKTLGAFVGGTDGVYRMRVPGRILDESNQFVGWHANTPGQLVSLMAMANAAQPADSPYKLTWPMVDALEERIGMAAVGDQDHCCSAAEREDSSRCHDLANAAIQLIKALLPPKENL